MLLSGRLHNEMGRDGGARIHAPVDQRKPAGRTRHRTAIPSRRSASCPGYKLMEDRKTAGTAEENPGQPLHARRNPEAGRDRKGKRHRLHPELGAKRHKRVAGKRIVRPGHTRVDADGGVHQCAAAAARNSQAGTGLLLNGTSRRAIIGGMSFAAGDTKEVRLRNRTRTGSLSRNPER